MLRHISHKNLGRSQKGWLDSHFHFSFAEYYNPKNIRFGVLRVMNDDIIQPNTGFSLHPHEDMEIISYVVKGELSHRDTIGNQSAITDGQCQYMSAGTGIFHSEYNHSDEALRFIQIWILPDKPGHKPNYGDYKFALEDRFDQLLPIATSVENQENQAPIKIHADINMYATILSKGSTCSFSVNKGRQAYLLLMEGEAQIGNLHLVERDALEIIQEDIHIHTKEGAHVLIIEMALDEACFQEKYLEFADQYQGE